MASRLKRTLATHLLGAALLTHAVLLPIVYGATTYIVAHTLEEQFVNQVRTYARVAADMLENEFKSMTNTHVDALLDRTVLGSLATYAELKDGNRSVAISTLAQIDPISFQEDFAFQGHGDNTYFLSVPLTLSHGRSMLLRLGFDERPTIEQISKAKRQTNFVLGSYLLASLILAFIFGRLVARPLDALRKASRRIAGGQHSARLEVKSSIVEIDELVLDLEYMRSELVGVNERLQQQMQEREKAESIRRRLESELRRSQRLETMGTFAGGIAHEFNNILQPLILYNELASDSVPKASATHGYLAQVGNCAKRAKALVNQILTFSREPAPEARQLLKLGSTVTDALTLARAMFPSTVEIQTDVDPDSATVRVDPGQIHQVVMNLLTNAYHAMRETGGLLTVQLGNCRREEIALDRAPNLQGDRFVCLLIADTGHGIGSETMQHIFEPFFTTREVGEGTGLGLAVVHGIITAHEGAIIIDSTVGSGTQVRVFLPVATDA